ncbi:VOC family protein [bacterium]|nr:VOC family protein [bacterium]
MGIVTGLHHIALKVADFDKTVAFYRDGLGFTQKLAWGEGDTRAVMLDIGDGSCVEIFAGGSPEARPEGAILHLALKAPSCDAALGRALEAGAVQTMAPTDVTIPTTTGPVPVRIAFCKAPGGEIVEFFQNK